MVFLEIAAQGVRGVAPAGGRLTLRPGYNVLGVDGPVFRSLLEALLYPESPVAEGILRGSSGPGGAAPRAGITLTGNDGLTYRLVRDFGGPCQLHRFDPQRRSFALLSQDVSQIQELLGGIGLPPRPCMTALLSISAAELPSRQVSSAHRTAPPARRPKGPAQTRKRLAELRAELDRAKAAEKLQYQLDGLQSKLFKLEEALRAGEKIREGIEAAQAARAELEQAGHVLGPFGDVDAKLAAYEKATTRRDEGLARVAEERSAVDEIAPGAPEPFWRNPLFLAGVATGVAAVVLAVAGSAMGLGAGTRYLALLDVPAFGFAGWVALRWVGDLEIGERSGRKRKILDERERKLVEQYEREGTEVREAMKALEVKSIGDLREVAGRIADAEAVAAEWRRRREEWEQKPETRGAVAEKARIEEALRQIEAKLVGESGGYLRDPRSIETEVDRLEGELAAPVPLEQDPEPTPVAAAAPAADPFMDLLARASTEFSTQPAGLVRAVHERVSQIAGTLTAQRLIGCLLAKDGNLQVHASGRLLNAATLPPPDADSFYIAMKLALLERSLAPGRLVGLVDDALSTLPEGARKVVARILKQVARPGQLLHGTIDAAFRDAADHAA